MKVTLNAANQFGVQGPQPGSNGEALYFTYDDADEVVFAVLFYGFPGVFLCYPGMVTSLGN